MKHEAIHEMYVSVISVNEYNDGTFVAKKLDGTVVQIDEAAVSVRAIELKNENNLKWLREERNKLLKDTDYWDASDTPNMTTEQINYRQALRDITKTYSSLNDVIWPEKP